MTDEIVTPSFSDLQNFRISVNETGISDAFNLNFTSSVLGSKHYYPGDLQFRMYIIACAQIARHHQSASFPVLCATSPTSLGYASHNKTQIINLQESMINALAISQVRYVQNVQDILNATSVTDKLLTFFPNITQKPQ